MDWLSDLEGFEMVLKLDSVCSLEVSVSLEEPPKELFKEYEVDEQFAVFDKVETISYVDVVVCSSSLDFAFFIVSPEKWDDDCDLAQE